MKTDKFNALVHELDSYAQETMNKKGPEYTIGNEDVLNNFNKEITDALIKNGCYAQGITNKQNNILYVEQENQNLGFVGTPKEINQSIKLTIINYLICI